MLVLIYIYTVWGYGAIPLHVWPTAKYCFVAWQLVSVLFRPSLHLNHFCILLQLAIICGLEKQSTWHRRMGRTIVFMKQLAKKLAMKCQKPDSKMMGYECRPGCPLPSSEPELMHSRLRLKWRSGLEMDDDWPSLFDRLYNKSLI